MKNDIKLGNLIQDVLYPDKFGIVIDMPKNSIYCLIFWIRPLSMLSKIHSAYLWILDIVMTKQSEFKIGDLVESIMVSGNIGIIYDIIIDPYPYLTLVKVFWITHNEFYDPHRRHYIKNLKLYGK